MPLKESEAPNAPSIGEVQLYGASYALVIGIDNYDGPSWARLSNAVSDAEKVAAALERRGFEVTLIRDATSEELEPALESFFIEKGRDPEARLFVWYAGHGYTLDGEGYLIPSDGKSPSDEIDFLRTSLSLRDFGKFARYAKSKHVLAVFDACFAGTVFNVARSAPPRAITEITTKPVRQFLSSGDAGQEVSDDGTFAQLFVDALDGNAGADANADGYLTGSEIGLFLSNKISGLTQDQQTPRYGKLRAKDFSLGDFVFQLASAAPSAPVATPSSGGSAAEQSPAPTQSSIDKEYVFWQAIENSKNAAEYEAYLKQYPNGAFAPLARARIKRLSEQKQETEQAQDDGADVIELDEIRFVDANGLSVRAGPGTAFEKVSRVERGDAVEVTGQTPDRKWYRIALSPGGTGYVFGKYLSTEEPASQPSEPRVVQRYASNQPAPTRPSSGGSSSGSGRIEIVNASGANFDPSFQQVLSDIVRRSLGVREWQQVERLVLRIGNIDVRTEANPEFAGAQMAQKIFGGLLGNLPTQMTPQTFNFYTASASVTVTMTSGQTVTDQSSIEHKGNANENRGQTLTSLITRVTAKAVERAAIRMSGGVPPIETSVLSTPGVSAPQTQDSSNLFNNSGAHR